MLADGRTRREARLVLAIHALWSRSGRLALWAEDSAGEPVPRRRPGRAPRIRPHPFGAGDEALLMALGPDSGADLKGAVTDLDLVLPTVTGPLPSPELTLDALLPDDESGEEPGTSGKDDDPSAPSITMAPWRVRAVEFDPDAALEIIAMLGAAAPATAVLGSSARHLLAVADFAADLTARGRVLPTASWGPDGAVACWLPVLTGADAAWARSLALAVPPSALALDPDSRTAAGLVAQVLDALVDAIARRRLGTRRLRTTGRRVAGGSGAGAPSAATVGAFLAALTGRQRRVAANRAEVEALAAELAAWQAEAVAGPVRACFRLVEPALELGELSADDSADEASTDEPNAADQSWRVEFALQATDEPSLVVDAERIWRARGRLRALGQQLEAPQETLLTQLARAHRLYPELEPALRTARPASLAMGTDGAHAFLAQAAPALSAAGFGVLLPGWWTRPNSRFGARLRASTPGAPGRVETESRFGLETMADFRWELAIGDEPLTAQELQDLAEARQPLVRMRGQWVSLDAKRLEAGLSLIRGDGASRMSLGDLLDLAGSADSGPGGLPVLGVEADGWLGDLLSGAAEQRLEPVTPAESFTGTLRPYQERGLAWLHFLSRLGLGAVLADDMGLGKTVQLLALMADDPGQGPTLLVCPMSLVGNWQREAARFTPQLRVHVHHGKERARGGAFDAAVADADLVITTYALAARDAAALGKVQWHRVVVDEAQAIKNAATRAAAAIRELPAAQRIAVTGTPVENRLADLWSIMQFANPGLLGSATAFKQRFATPVEKHGDPDAALRLRQMTQPFILRRMKTDTSIISDLPKKMEMEVVCNLTREQAALYQAVVDDMLEKIENSEGMERRGLVLATMTKLKQVCNHPAHLLRDSSALTSARSGKLQRLDEILEEVLSAGEKALLFTQFAEFGGMLRSHLTARFGREVAFLHGGVAKAARDDLVARFQGGGPSSPSLFVLSLKAGGTGLTLTAANHVVHVDRWWNPAVEDQATDRAFRIGQRRAVQVRAFVCAGTLEERIATMIRDKRGLAASIVGTGESWLTELSTTQLRELITLDRAAVVE
jgi:superfamily II DNA or RNA helicase